MISRYKYLKIDCIIIESFQCYIFHTLLHKRMRGEEVTTFVVKFNHFFSVTVKLAKWFLLDYRFLSQPSFQSTFMETYHKVTLSNLLKCRLI